MNKDELLSKIEELKIAAAQLEGPEKVFKMSELEQLKIEILGMSVRDIAEKIQEISLPDIESMNAEIEAAKEANTAHETRVEAIGRVCDMIRGIVGLVI